MFSRFCALVAVGCGLSVQGMSAASVEYPGLGNFNLNEGTVEIWFVPQGELTPDAKVPKWRPLYCFLELDSPGNFSAQLALAQTPSGVARMRCRMTSEAGEVLPIGMDKEIPLGWETGKLGRITLAWKGRWMGFYANGTLLAERTQLIPLTGSAASLTVRLGGQKGEARPWVMKAVRISSVARTAEELANPSPEADAATLLLDRASDWKNVKTMTQPLIVAGIAGQAQGGLLKGSAKVQPDGVALN